MRKSVRPWLLYIVATTVIVLDQYTKHLVRARIPLNTSLAPIPGLGNLVTLIHVQNTGAAFGIFTDSNLIFIILSSVVAALIVIFNRQFGHTHWLLPLTFGLQVGGALGNLVDRVSMGAVTDFVDLHWWPVFNVADSAVVVGTALLAYYALFLDRASDATDDEKCADQDAAAAEESS